ncbi:MAG: CBS domain-containing protein [Candidatus Omnitrophota bacterium]|jgi:CBS domain-containing protein|nr:MAG: CBS domain-containing protein [Candidatus Omnitrophota bacterium]
MSIRYAVIEIFTSEEARWHGKPATKAVVEFVSQLGIAARCLVTRGIAGCYETGDIATSGIEILSYNLPLKMEIVLPASELDVILPQLEEMVDDGILMIEEQDAWVHKTRSRLIPRHLKVNDVMTHNPQAVKEQSPLTEVITLMIRGGFNGVPVIADDGRPIGIITQGDLIARGGLPIRLGLLSEFPSEKIEEFIETLAQKPSREIMSSPVQTIPQNHDLSEAVTLMLKHNLKRLPVVDDQGRLSGMLARLDVFKTVMRESPDWRSFAKHHVKIDNLRFVRDVMQRDTQTVYPETPIDEIIRIIDQRDSHRVAVVDTDGKLIGIVSDRDVFAQFSAQRAGLWPILMSKVPLLKSNRFYEEIVKSGRAKTASDIMIANPIAITEYESVQEAINLMTEKRLKRLPVVDEQGFFKGMISRDAVLRIGMESSFLVL